ncbi:Type cbb3 cytochrome oxidase biogenesis protein CcoG, involved in Cu oxidation [Lutibaculum baratangense AMV1]|uniref:Type cbb3 cytochrome oxidase biogenesis protein CcoG, involved in Cu oxidation n=1 Tax=Lutibaculum baratangense AMV1 TaxID=631454 RepID=V4TAG6_9HYPH|nr:Type cbb3 cytochrome oxidase biogenesis protein CcoG, involved in Cu oxidation [Lutibaculum baratangense AMV1]
MVPASVEGRFRRIKWHVLTICLLVYYAVPFLRWDRGPGQPLQAVLFDVERVRFYLFGIEIWPQELYYLTLLLVLATVVLVLMNALAGRIWCGFACPQTVWSDLFMLVERWIEGDRRERLRKMYEPKTPRRIAEIGLKHIAWLLIASATGGAFILYFADAPTLLVEVFTGEASTAAYAVILSLTFTTYALAGFAREKVCTFMCPWPRLQGAIWDPEALTVNYRDHRGEERMSVKKAKAAREAGLPAGDCVDCAACVNVCPMGIDIREGPSIACINCGLCVDACDDTMGKIGRERGLIDYESWTNIERGRRSEPRRRVRLVRPKTMALATAALVLLAVPGLSLGTRATMAMSVSHVRNPSAVLLSNGDIRNAYEVRLVNKSGEARTVHLSSPEGTVLEVPGYAAVEDETVPLELGADASQKVRVLVTASESSEGEIAFTLSDTTTGETVRETNLFHRPR